MHLPKELIGEEDDDDGISFTASLTGTPYNMDLYTKKRRKLDYSRVCVLVSAEQYFLTEMMVDVERSVIFNIEYEWLPRLAIIAKYLGTKSTHVSQAPEVEKKT